MRQAMRFHDLAIGQKFDTGFIHSCVVGEADRYLVYKKIGKRKAICVDQIGYGNNRQVGAPCEFNVFYMVWQRNNGE